MAAASGVVARFAQVVRRGRERAPILDHLVRTQQHFSAANGSVQAGGVTYYAFLSFFPVLALAFFVVGYLARVFPDAQENLVAAIEQVLPGLVGSGKGQISLTSMRDHAATAGVIGLLGVGYAGLGWVSALRSALLEVFMLPPGAKPNFLVGKARDLVALVVIGVTLVASVAVSGLVSGFSGQVLGWLSLSTGSAPALWLVSVVVGLAASTLLFFSLFTLLARPPAPRRALWSGALLGALAFEVLKWASSYLVAATRSQPAAQAFGIALILLVWINYFSRVVLYAAAWAHTAANAGAGASIDERPASTEGREVGERGAASGSGPGRRWHEGEDDPPGWRTDLAGAFVTGAGVTGVVAAWVALRARRRGTDDGSAGN